MDFVGYLIGEFCLVVIYGKDYGGDFELGVEVGFYYFDVVYKL